MAPCVLLFLACAVSPESAEPLPGVPMDGAPDAALTQGEWTFSITSARASVSGPRTLDLGPDVLQGAAFRPGANTLVIARAVGSPLPDLFAVNLETGHETQLTDWPGYEDRPCFSPDGSRLAFFSGRTGLPALYVVNLAETPGLIEPAAATQFTNVGLETHKRVGAPPEGFVSPPEDGKVSWTDAGITWTARGESIVVTP